MNHSRWNLLPPAPPQYLSRASGLSPLTAQLLYNRGITDPADIKPFLISGSDLSADPSLLPNIEAATGRIYRALLSGEKVAIYGDFDADGITGTALLVQGLRSLGGDVIPYIPHRLTEGYGLKTATLDKLRKDGISLVVTVDCGITAVAEVEKAQRNGLDIVITDHHTPLPKIPSAVAAVNPKLPGSRYPFQELTGVGVAFKLLQALLQGMGKEKQAEEMMDLVAMGTIADIAPLMGENRYLVKEGLKLINRRPRPGLRALIDQTGLTQGSIDSENISWVLVPRLNAAGRLAHAMTSYNLLMTDSLAEARQLSQWLDQKNTERQKLTATTLKQAREQVLAEGISPLLIADDKDYPLGIAGLVAGRMSDEFYRPTIVIRTGERTSSGSCRSIPEFNIIQALNQCHDLLSYFGGHSQAAGFTLPTDNLPRFKQCLRRLADAELKEADLQPQMDIDAEATLPELGGDTFRAIQRLAPFGCGNPAPTFVSRRVEVVSCRTMGSNRDHLKMRLRQDNAVWDGVGFRCGERLAEAVSPLDVVYNLEIDKWSGEDRLRLNLTDFAPSLK